MELRQYQKDAVAALTTDRHICIAGTGVGKTLTSLTVAKQSEKKRVLVCTMAGVRDARVFEQEAEAWYPDWYQALKSFEVVSWAGLAKWVTANWEAIPGYYFIFDEVDCAAAGISSLRGKAFLQVTGRTQAWSGYTATPGENWLQFYPYFTACGKVRNKTEFKRKFCIEQHYPFPMILGYQDTETLEQWWREISYTVDDSTVQAELPPATHTTLTFKQPSKYKTVEKTSTTIEGDFLDNASAYRHYLRQLCCSSEKLTWLTDFVSKLQCPVIVLYNYNAEFERLDSALKKATRGKVWHINGAEHDIPTADTIGQHDVVLVQWASGSRGLNLQFINYWVSVSPADSYRVSVQGRGRIRRIGQDRPQYYYYLRCEGTVEEAVYKALKGKGDFAAELWVAEQQAKYKFNWKEEK